MCVLLPVCSCSAGTAESWRSDFSRFNSTDLGAVVPGRPKERFLDVSSKRVRTVIRKVGVITQREHHICT
jgi:hypothetical protein